MINLRIGMRINLMIHLEALSPFAPIVNSQSMVEASSNEAADALSGALVSHYSVGCQDQQPTTPPQQFPGTGQQQTGGCALSRPVPLEQNRPSAATHRTPFVPRVCSRAALWIRFIIEFPNSMIHSTEALRGQSGRPFREISFIDTTQTTTRNGFVPPESTCTCDATCTSVPDGNEVVRWLEMRW